MAQPALFDERSNRWESIEAPGAELFLRRRLYDEETATRLLHGLIKQVPWREDTIKMFGREHKLPRLQQWFGDPGQVYVWSGIEMQPLPWHPLVQFVRQAVQEATGREFNSVLLNYYRDGNDTVSWHADDEKGLGLQPLIASVSLGAERDFVMRRTAVPSEKLCIPLSSGSLLVMGGDTQANWQHSIPRRKRVNRPRVNLTFRRFE